MNDWWASQAEQKYWVEITDRPDLGQNIIAPQRAQGGKSTPGYDLLNYVQEGDIVFHWWRRPSNPEDRGFYGFSEVIGAMQVGTIPWKSRGRYAEAEVAGPKPAQFWNLTNFTEFQSPILIGELNAHKEAIFDLIASLENLHGHPIYFPFCKRQGKVSANQTYFAKLPLELLHILAVKDFDQSKFAPSSLVAEKVSQEERLGSSSAFARQMDPEKRSAVEKYAESEVRQHLENLGYSVEKFGKPFDFLATKHDEKVKVEVKGKQDFAVSVEVTRNEVEVARNVEGTYRTLLAVVDGIQLNYVEETWKGSGGRMRTWWDMPFEEASLIPTRYQFILPVE